MPSLSSVLVPRLGSALGAAFGPEFADADPVLRLSKFADVQVNVALALAKQVGLAPREVAARIVARGDLPFLHVAESNTAAIRLYEALGFGVRRTVVFRGFRVPGEAAR